MPTGIDLTAITIEEVIKITVHGTSQPNERKTRYGTAMLKSVQGKQKCWHDKLLDYAELFH